MTDLTDRVDALAESTELLQSLIRDRHGEIRLRDVPGVAAALEAAATATARAFDAVSDAVGPPEDDEEEV